MVLMRCRSRQTLADMGNTSFAGLTMPAPPVDGLYLQANIYHCEQFRSSQHFESKGRT